VKINEYVDQLYVILSLAVLNTLLACEQTRFVPNMDFHDIAVSLWQLLSEYEGMIITAYLIDLIRHQEKPFGAEARRLTLRA
jgi:hypothetical protein